MRLKITHTTRYDYDSPVPFGLQQLRTTPKSTRAQSVLQWQTSVEGGAKQLSFEDFHRNTTELVSFDPGTTGLVIRSEGEVEMTDTAGIVGPHQGFTPLWLFLRSTDQTRIGAGVRQIAKAAEGETDLERLHDLSARIREAVTYQVGASEPTWTAEEAITAGQGVCADHTHIFVACARHLGFPARYVSGYLMMNDRVDQDATHAWAEAHVEGLGWVGFDISNAISPDMRYVRVATGLDYPEAAPISGRHYGSAGETLSVSLEVMQQQ
ncbi:transglutaminase family protein [Cognatishimia sp. MH4019]|uniref:transglutaminase family protein n=1 Tax=Cognatishimia sp. MH4019 TaxID=2854030 RepID=UPI001CD5F0D9|nr:transglutaminase family protein [Cognatishimia sp. MH4019]